jgi:hypothetical protein
LVTCFGVPSKVNFVPISAPPQKNDSGYTPGFTGFTTADATAAGAVAGAALWNEGCTRRS